MKKKKNNNQQGGQYTFPGVEIRDIQPISTTVCPQSRPVFWVLLIQQQKPQADLCNAMGGGGQK